MRRSLHARPSSSWRDALFFSPPPYLTCFLFLLSLPLALSRAANADPTPASTAKPPSIAPFKSPLSNTTERLPLIGPHGDYVTSHACTECHQEQHGSWHKSFHRTMTQLAATNSVLGDFNGTSIQAEGLVYRVFRDGEKFLAEMPDPDLMMYAVQGQRKIDLKTLPRVIRPVALTTGSHHYQTYWVSSTRHPTVLHSLPLVYLLAEKRWIPRESAFIHGPDDAERFFAQWNNQCIRCHSTGGNPGLEESSGQLNTRVAELGIACEACHGPGKQHVETQRELKLKNLATPANRARLVDRIVNPAKLDHKASTELCGQCHGEYVHRQEFAMEFAKNGPLYHPGDNLHRTRYYIQHPRPGSASARWKDVEANPDFFRQRWWPDGTILAGGREYTALRASACYLKGQISCLTCHSMHESDPNDQLKRIGNTSKACQQCHHEPKYNESLTSHTHHLAGSSGSECMNCHMPHTSYALLKGIRSHQISSPRLDEPVRLGVPNACNLCHLDRTLEWTATRMTEWFHQKSIQLTEDQKTVPASMLWALKGDAAQRAITSWHYGWTEAQRTSGTNWMAPVLAPLLNDDYGVIRQITARTLQSIRPELVTNYDFLAAPEVRSRFAKVGEEKEATRDLIHRLLKEQDKRSVSIQE